MKLKSLAAATLAVIAASQAHAGIDALTGDASELYFVLGNDKGSFLLDTGLTLAALKSPTFTSYVKNVTDLTGFSSFVAGSTPLWALAVYDGLGTANFSQIELLSTRSATLVNNAGINNTSFKSAVFNNTTSIAQAAANTGTHPTLANGSSFNAVGTPGYFSDKFFKLGQPVNQIGNVVGATSILIDRNGTTGNALAQTTVTPLLGYTASFNGTTLTVSAVPEPSTYAMLLAGIAAVGFVARRRRI